MKPVDKQRVFIEGYGEEGLRPKGVVATKLRGYRF